MARYQLRDHIFSILAHATYGCTGQQMLDRLATLNVYPDEGSLRTALTKYNREGFLLSENLPCPHCGSTASSYKLSEQGWLMYGEQSATLDVRELEELQ